MLIHRDFSIKMVGADRILLKGWWNFQKLIILKLYRARYRAVT